MHRLDGRDAALVRLDGARGEKLPGGDLGALLDRATIALCAEMLGNAEAALDMTSAHLKSRVQFGVPIGTFQALQHRAARLFVELELMRAAVWSAHALLDAGGDVRAAASVAKAKCSDAAILIGHEAIQMHGGIGMTEEHDIGLFLKRARVAEMTFGDAAFHRDRFATLTGF
jgi:alkylation response protein AidB-like acyl-CoA dehydrogenase